MQWMSNVKQTVSNGGDALKDSNANTDASNKPQVNNVYVPGVSCFFIIANFCLYMNFFNDKNTPIKMIPPPFAVTAFDF